MGGALRLPSSGCWDRGSWGRAGVRGLRCMERCLGLFLEPRASPCGARVAHGQQEGRWDLQRPPPAGGIQAHLSHLSGWESEKAPWPPASPRPTSSTVPCCTEGPCPHRARARWGAGGRAGAGLGWGVSQVLGTAGRCLGTSETEGTMCPLTPTPQQVLRLPGASVPREPHSRGFKREDGAAEPCRLPRGSKGILYVSPRTTE